MSDDDAVKLRGLFFALRFGNDLDEDALRAALFEALRSSHPAATVDAWQSALVVHSVDEQKAYLWFDGDDRGAATSACEALLGDASERAFGDQWLHTASQFFRTNYRLGVPTNFKPI